MFDYSRRNSGEKPLPQNTSAQPSKDSASHPRPTLEQLVNEVTGPAEPESNWNKNRGVIPEAVPAQNGYVRPPANWKNAGEKPAVPPVSRPEPLVYKRPEVRAAKLVNQSPTEWKGKPSVSYPKPIPTVKAESRTPAVDPCLPLDTMSTAEHHLPEGTIGKMLPAELIYVLQAQTNHDSIYTKLSQFCKRHAHNPLLELASGTVAFVASEESGRIRVYIGSMRDYCLFSRRTNMLEGTLAIEEMFEYETSYGQLVVVHKRAGEIVPGLVAGRKMYPVLEFISYTESGCGKASCYIKSQWR
ncbi:MAG: hypothetical protein K2W95_16505 [Candidatus Obscuribacterales bacterium]|nr:hypothetical protein [Candidatus Obscuribacterales bacterium]